MADADDGELLYDVVLAAAVVVVAGTAQIIADRRRRKRRKMWVRSLFQNRLQYGAYNQLMAELRGNDTGRYHGFTRLSMKILWQTER